MNKVANILGSKHFIFTKDIISNIDYDMSLDEFLLLIYFINSNELFDPERIANDLGISVDRVMSSFNLLISNNIISLESKKDNNGKIVDVINLDSFFNKIDNSLNDDIDNKVKNNIFDKIEVEFGRNLSPIECEIINGWLDTYNNEELIIGALKEASFNGVKNLRYIDKILYEWGKKGFKSMDDVEKHMKSKVKEEKEEELYDYDWLNDDE